MAGLPEVGDATFDRDVLQSTVPVVVDFWAPWCGPCKMITPILREIADTYGDRLRVVAVNIDENPQLVERYAVQSVPTVAVFTDAEPVKRIAGGRSKSMLIKELAPYL